MQEKQRGTIIAALVALFRVWVIGGVTTAEAQQKFTGCLKNNGKIVRVAPGDSPTKPCKSKQTEFMFPGTDKTDALMEKDVEFMGDVTNLQAKDVELMEKDSQLMAKDTELMSDISGLEAKDVELMAKDQALTDKDDELMEADDSLQTQIDVLDERVSELKANAQTFPGDGYPNPDAFGVSGHGPELSYTDNGDLTATDNLTKFHWELKLAADGSDGGNCLTIKHSIPTPTTTGPPDSSSYLLRIRSRSVLRHVEPVDSRSAHE